MGHGIARRPRLKLSHDRSGNLMIALKGASEDLRSHFYRTMSTRAVDMMKEDSEVMGPVRSKDVAKAQAEIVAIARKLESEGKIVLKSQGEDEYVL